MWENETVVLFASLKSRILGKDKRIHFEKIVNDNAIPPFVKALFEKRVDGFMENDSPISIRTSDHFNIKPEDLDTLRLRLLAAFRNKAVFYENDVETILRDALVIRLDYLVRPIDTMRRLLFEGSSTIGREAIETTLMPFRNILSYADQFVAACRNESDKQISAEEYTSIADKVLINVLGSNPIEPVLQEFSTLKTFLSEARGEEIHRVEAETVQQFLGDRNLWGFRRAIEVEVKLGRSDFDTSDLEIALKRYSELKQEFGFEESIASGSGDDDNGNGTHLANMTQSKFDEIGTIEDSDEWALEEVLGVDSADGEEYMEEEGAAAADRKCLEKDNEDAEGETEKIEKKEYFSDHKPEADMSVEEVRIEPGADFEIESDKPVELGIVRRDENDISDKDKEGDFDVLPPEVHHSEPDAPPPPAAASRIQLKSLIDDKTKKVFIKKLFSSDKEAYEALLGKLDASESWRVAKILIDNELFKHDVDPFSREAIKLVDLVYSRFYPEEGVGG